MNIQQIKAPMNKIFCHCCGEEIEGVVCHSETYGDGVKYGYCSWECSEFKESEHREYLDSYSID